MSAAAPAGPASDARQRFASNYVESVFLTWIANGARIVLGIVALRLVTGSIGESDLGAYWILTSLATLLANLADLGVGLGVVRHLPLAPGREAAGRLMRTVLVLRLASLALLCVGIALGKPAVLRLFDAEAISEKYGYLYAFVIVNSLGELYTNFLQGLNRFRQIAVFALLSSLARLAGIVVFVRILGQGVEGLFLTEVAALLLVVLLSAAWSAHGWKLAIDRRTGREQLRFGLPLYLNTILSYTAFRINTVMIGGMTGPVAVSWFTVASRMPDQLWLVLRAYNSVYLPNMSRLAAEAERAPSRRLLAASLRLMGFAFAMLAILLTFFRHEVLALLAPPSYQVAAPAVPLLAGGVAFAALGSIMGFTFVALGDSRTPLAINAATTAISLALNWICIARWGFMGAAWASLAFNALAYGITDAVLSRRMPPENRSYLVILGFLGVILLAGLRAGLALRIVLLVAAAAGSLLLSADLRSDLLRLWNLWRRRAAPPPATGAGAPEVPCR